MVKGENIFFTLVDELTDKENRVELTCQADHVAVEFPLGRLIVSHQQMLELGVLFIAAAVEQENVASLDAESCFELLDGYDDDPDKIRKLDKMLKRVRDEL